MAVCEELVALLSQKIKKVGDAEVIIKAGKGHRFVVVFRGKGLEGPLSDADPHREARLAPGGAGESQVRKEKAAKLVAGFYQAALPCWRRRSRPMGSGCAGSRISWRFRCFKTGHCAAPGLHCGLSHIRGWRNWWG